MNYNVIISLIESAHFRFKQEFPDEEPFFRITCTRRYGRANRSRVWRPKDREMRVVDQQNNPTFSEIPDPGSINLDESKLLGKKESAKIKNDLSEQKPLGGKKLELRPTKVIDKDIRTLETTKVGYDACVDLRLNDPLTVNVIKYCTDETNYILKELRSEYKVFLEDPLLHIKGSIITTDLIEDIDSLEHRLDMINELRSKQENLEKDFAKIERISSSINIDEFESLTQSVKLAFKESTTVQEVVSKYITVQKKLNSLKSKVLPLMRKYSEEPFIKLIEDEGFIATVWKFIEYLHGNTMDDYSSEVLTAEDLEINERIRLKKESSRKSAD